MSSLKARLPSLTRVDMADEGKKIARQESSEPMEEVMLNDKLRQAVKIGPRKEELSSFLREYKDVFT